MFKKKEQIDFGINLPEPQQEEVDPQLNNLPLETVQIESDDPNKYEIEVQEMINRKCNELQGKVLDPVSREWTTHPNKERIMNELGAWEFKQEINSRVFLNMTLSDLDPQFTLTASAQTGKVYANKLADNWEKWGVKPLESNFHSIALQLVHMIYICLQIAKNQGMRKHREKRGTNRIYQRPMQEGVM
tara:strand:+ start:321 stop:884 length:564 start_codon:yes stop_codon:yes gene_type:complete